MTAQATGRPLGSTSACMTHREIAEALGLSKQRVQQIEQSALAKLACHPVLREIAASLDLALPPVPVWRCRWCQAETPEGLPRCGSCRRARAGGKVKV